MVKRAERIDTVNNGINWFSLVPDGDRYLKVTVGRAPNGGPMSLVYVRDLTGRDVIPPIDARQQGIAEPLATIEGFRSKFTGTLKLVVNTIAGAQRPYYIIDTEHPIAAEVL